MGPKAKINKLLKQFPEIPSLLYKALDNAQQRKLALLREHIDSHQRNTLWAMIAAATLISLAVLFQ